ncbi:MAG: hypothetical protein ABFS37_10385, partial [Acidobacteriota bacterium]
MKTRNRTILNFVVLLTIMALTGQAGAGIQPRLEGSLSNPGAMVVTTRTSTTVALDQGVVHLETGAIRLVRGESEGGFLQIEAFGLTPESRYMVLAGQTPVYAFSADSNGRYSARITDRIRIEGSVMVRNSGRPFASGLSGLTVVDLATGLMGFSGPDHAKREQIETTPLCGNHPQSSGQATVTVDGDFQMFMAEGWGLAPSIELMVIADGIPIGPTVTDEWGSFFLIAGNDPGAGIPLPPELDPVTDIAEILIVTPGQNTVLFGNFDDPCTGGGGGGGGDPVGSGYISICGGDANMMIGSMDWVVFADGLQVAMVSAFELPPDAMIDVTFDSTLMGSAPTSPFGDFFVAFSSEPIPGDLPFPPDAPPLDQVQTVDLTSGGVVVGSGTNGEDCDWIDPPIPVEEGYTQLCPVDPGAFAFGETGWVVWDDGIEEFFVGAFGLEPNSTLNLIVDGHDLGAFTASDWGDIFLHFSSDPSGGGGPGQGGDVLPLPGEIQPVSAIDQVSLVSPDGALIVAGSFVDGCDDIPDPPLPVDEGYTDLCPVDPGTFAAGMTGWTVWDDGTENFFVDVFGLDPNSALNLIVDGHDLGAFAASDRGDLFLHFSSDPSGGGGPGQGGDVLPLPAEIRPVSAIDQVSLVSPDGAPIVAGSFIDGCDDIPDPPLPVDESYTELCPATDGRASGEVGWFIWNDGTEQLMVTAFSLEPESSHQIIVDGFDLGFFDADEGGSLWVDFSSDPIFAGQVLLPEEVRPVSDIDVVEIRDAQGTLIVAGSFAEPCSMEWDFEGDATGLCNDAGGHGGDSLWWMSTIDGHVIEENLFIIFWETEDAMTYFVNIDGVSIGEMMPIFGDDNVVVGLTLGGPGDEPIPDELSPISGIDSVQVFDGAGRLVVSGSYSEPCTGDNPGGPGD